VTGNETSYSDFLRATSQGYVFASKNPEEAATIVREAMLAHNLHERDTDLEFLKESQKAINAYYNISGESFGRMDAKIWQAFLDFLQQQDLLKDRNGADVAVRAEDLFTNALLEV
jgi:ABC-type nitrate/sulfonate/bicarbonate transport system substrate-binding protein